MASHTPVSRRRLLGAGAATSVSLLLPPIVKMKAVSARQGGALAPELAIDIAAEPPTLDPALTYEVDGWSVVHSIYDSLVQFGPDGSLQMVLAESLTQSDPLTWEIKLRPDVVFHNGEPLDAAAVAFSIAHILDPETASQVAANFQVIEEVEEIEAFALRLHLSAPAPWLPSQIAPWLAVLPPLYAGDPANDFGANPIGTGPYRFLQWDRGSGVVLERNTDYFTGSAKGQPIADNVTYRFVTDRTTRVSDVISGTSQLVRGVPVDEFEAVAETAEVVAQPIAGCAFVRIPTDVEPFNDPRVRLALNHAVDVKAIIDALIGGNGQRLANFFVPGGLGYDEALQPHAYDPELARSLLAEAGYPDGISTRLAYTPGDQVDPVEAIAGQLTAAGIQTEVEAVELATFNSTWQDPEAAPLRLLTWRPLIDPFTLLNLVVSNTGYLSRYDNPEAQTLLDAAAVEPDPEARNATYQQLGRVLHDSPAAIYLWNLTSFYGVARDAPPWTPRVDDWILPLVAED